eukprot:TRINITY_DN775892_c0_g1_i1.p1 TRINITY_DN775892_c0_g1~~TRINITY_DN775892_c0_g1_i1.p1  ORF type:complete len:240 (+),score=66.18 TRINITY_DN775892_c0_g1_i1:32-721(+)
MGDNIVFASSHTPDDWDDSALLAAFHDNLKSHTTQKEGNKVLDEKLAVSQLSADELIQKCKHLWPNYEEVIKPEKKHVPNQKENDHVTKSSIRDATESELEQMILKQSESYASPEQLKQENQVQSRPPPAQQKQQKPGNGTNQQYQQHQRHTPVQHVPTETTNVSNSAALPMGGNFFPASSPFSSQAELNEMLTAMYNAGFAAGKYQASMEYQQQAYEYQQASQQQGYY